AVAAGAGGPVIGSRAGRGAGCRAAPAHAGAGGPVEPAGRAAAERDSELLPAPAAPQPRAAARLWRGAVYRICRLPAADGAAAGAARRVALAARAGPTVAAAPAGGRAVSGAGALQPRLRGPCP